MLRFILDGGFGNIGKREIDPDLAGGSTVYRLRNGTYRIFGKALYMRGISGRKKGYLVFGPADGPTGPHVLGTV